MKETIRDEIIEEEEGNKRERRLFSPLKVPDSIETKLFC